MQYYAIAISISIKLQRRGRRNLGIEQEVNAIEQSGVSNRKEDKSEANRAEVIIIKHV